MDGEVSRIESIIYPAVSERPGLGHNSLRFHCSAFAGPEARLQLQVRNLPARTREMKESFGAAARPRAVRDVLLMVDFFTVWRLAFQCILFLAFIRFIRISIR